MTQRLFIFLLTLLPLAAAAQSARPEGFRPPTLETMKTKDLSMLWIGPIPSIDLEDTTTLAWSGRPDPLGYIGNDFKRFDIHIGNIWRTPDNPLRYRMQGQTRTGDNCCPFEGELLLDSLTCSLTQNEGTPDFYGGIGSGWCLWGHYSLREDPRYPGSGVLEGVHAIAIAVDSEGSIYYDTLFMAGDGYSNNQWEGTWRSHKTGSVKTCNWGDYRIPESQELDIGCGEFCPSEEYRSNGWQNYYNAWGCGDRSAQIEETRRWWSPCSY